MDLHMEDNQTGHWTNEKHVDFLNTVEASFVRKMLENDGRRHPRLDRYMPDSSESTLDLKSQRRKKPSASGNIIGSRSSRSKMGRRSSYHHWDDQVVPEVESRGGGKGERDGRHHHHHSNDAIDESNGSS